ncbi:MAG: hypothetical protein ACMUHM_02735 [Thermoplasmatota archaeon]
MKTVELLELVSHGGRSVTELAALAGMDKDVFMARLTDLERMGYLKRLELGSGCGTDSCGNCPMRRSCDDGASLPVIFTLSGKGKRVLEKRIQYGN